MLIIVKSSVEILSFNVNNQRDSNELISTKPFKKSINRSFMNDLLPRHGLRLGRFNRSLNLLT